MTTMELVSEYDVHVPKPHGCYGFGLTHGLVSNFLNRDGHQLADPSMKFGYFTLVNVFSGWKLGYQLKRTF